MKSFKQFITEAQVTRVPSVPNAGQVVRNTLRQVTPGKIVRAGASILNPITGLASNPVNALGNVAASAVGGVRGRVIKALTPVASTVAPFVRGAAPAGVAYEVLRPRATASGRVQTGSYKGKSVYMDK